MGVRLRVSRGPSGESLPSVEDACAVKSPQSACKTCPSDDESLRADTSEGTTLANSWSDAQCHVENLTILARVGQKLARFTGTGFIALDSGIARVVNSVPLKLQNLWHKWWKPTATSRPILGEPLPYPMMAVGDDKGNIHAIQGPTAEDATPYWDSAAEQFTQRPISENRLPRKGVVTSVADLELVGYVPISDGQPVDTVRDMKALAGAGLMYLETTVTVDDGCECAPNNGVASVAKTLPLPIPYGTETYTLKFSAAEGLHWSEDDV